MKHRLKGLLALVLSLTMVFALATNAWAAPAPSATSVKIGHSVTFVTLNSANPYWKNDGTPASADDYNAYFDAANGILTLYDANISVTNYAYGIRASGNLTISLIGDNEVMSAGESGGAYGVRCDGTLTIKGSGSLTAVGANPDYPTGYGICADSIEITEGTVIAQGKVRAVDTAPIFNPDTHKATASEYFNGNPVSEYVATNFGSYKYLKIEPITCTVTFDLNGRGTMTTATQTDIPAGGKVDKPADPTEAGWTFGGWYTDDGAWTDAWNFDTDTVTEDITLYAKWTENTLPAKYTVKFDANGGSGTMNDATDVSGDYTLPANGFTAPAGKEFIGWSVDPAGAERMRPGEQRQITKDTTLYAIWKSTSGNGGQGPSIPVPYPPYNPTPESEVTAPKTFDSGVALHIGLTILAASGSAWLAKKKD